MALPPLSPKPFDRPGGPDETPLTSEGPPVSQPNSPPTEADGSKGTDLQDGQKLLDDALEASQAAQEFWGKGEIGQAVTALDKAYSILLQVDSKDNSELMQQKEDIRFMICKRLLEMYAAQHRVANGKQKEIPLVMNPYVEREIALFQGPERNFFLDSYHRSGRYQTQILKALEQAGIPKELSWLPLIESGFKVEAFSRARALGLWQFIPSTGYKFGLKRDQWLDERMDVEKSTQAAIAYLRELHKIFGDWSTALAAYNCGEAKVLQVIRNQKINYLDNFWDLFAQLPRETARYVPRFLATLFIISDPEKFGFQLKSPASPFPYETVMVSKQMVLKDIAQILKIPADPLEDLNPELRYKITPPGPYALKIPEGMGEVLTTRIEEIPTSKYSPTLYTHHQVRSGETLSHLARHYGTTIRAIAETNHLQENSLIRVGRTLKIPSGRRVSAKPSLEKRLPDDPSQFLRHRVQRGDSLWKIVHQYNADLKEVMRLNKLETTLLQIDQELLIPSVKP
jgi:membrane-bound lytic murein transglycosylase D